MRRLAIWKETRYSSFWCPACDDVHSISLAPGGWTLEGDAERPVTQPSIRVSRIGPEIGDKTLCHCYLEGENIRFCSDSPHALAGQTVPLPYFPMDFLTAEQIADLEPVSESNG